jgi:ABC-type phosphate transport system substrate-binding protein
MGVRTWRVVLTVAAGALAALAPAATSAAGPPVPSQACVDAPNGDPSDGEISGRGATFANRVQAALIAGYESDVCGTPGMVHYNDAALLPGIPTGSGAGQVAASWRAEMFGGSDIPYDINTLNLLNASCGAVAGAHPGTPLMPPVQTPCTDPATPVMSFPIAGSAVALGVNLDGARDCGGTATGPLRLDRLRVLLLLGGMIKTWDHSVLRSNGLNAWLADCHVPVTRVVRQDRSGTTQILKNYLARASGTSPGFGSCTTVRWGVQPGQPSQPTDLNLDAQNREWPGQQADPPDGTLPSVPATTDCTAIARNPSNGNGPLLATLNATPGGIGYADLAEMVAQPALIRPLLRNGTDTAFVRADDGFDANCRFTALTLPGGGDPGASVGLDPGDSWAFDQVGGHADATMTGSAYPICGLTFALVYTGLSDTTGTPDAVSRMTNNQRRTLFGYFTYVLSSLGQSRMSGIFYADLPRGWLLPMRAGFQENF